MAEPIEHEIHEPIDSSAPSGPDDIKRVNVSGKYVQPTRYSKRAKWLIGGAFGLLILVATFGITTIISTRPTRVVETVVPPLTAQGKAPTSTNSDIDKIVANAPQGLDGTKTRTLPVINGQPGNDQTVIVNKPKDSGQDALNNALKDASTTDKNGDPLGVANGKNLSNGTGANTPSNPSNTAADKTVFDTSGPTIPNPGANVTIGGAGTPIAPVAGTGSTADSARTRQDSRSSGLFVGGQNQGQEQAASAAETSTQASLPQANSIMSGTNQAPPQQGSGGGGGGSSAIAFANGQGEKPAYLVATQLSPVGKYELWAGSIIPAILDTGINSNLPGPVIGHVLNDVYDSKTGQTLLIPKGSRLIGRYNTNVSPGVPRVQVVWDRLIWTDGKFISLAGQIASEPEGQSGLYADVNDHRGRLITASIFTALISSGSQILANKGGAGGQATSTQASNGQITEQNVGGAIAQTGSTYITKQAQIPDELTVPRGKPFNVLLDRTIVLPPWHYE